MTKQTNKKIPPGYRHKKPDFPRWEELTMVPVVISGEMNSPEGEIGKYEVRFWFTTYAKGLSIPSNMHVDNPCPEPDSYLHIKIDTGNPETSIANLKLDSKKLSYLLEVNSKGRLSQIVVELEAKTFQKAIDKSYSELMPFLSYWAFEINTPFVINAIKATYETGSFRFLSLMDGQVKLFPSDKFVLAANNTYPLGYLGLYREALSSAHLPLYQVFLLHRIREGIYNNRPDKKQLDNENISKVCKKVHFDFHGRSYKQIHGKIEQKFRNHFAHFNTTKTGLLKQNPDRFDNFYECITKWLPVSFYITRQMIKNEFKNENKTN